MPIVIRAFRDGFRRCGLAHPATPVEHPDDRFSAAEIARLRADPMLVVEERAGGAPARRDVADAIRSLDAGDMKKDGRPRLDAVRAALPEDVRAGLTAEIVEDAWVAMATTQG